MKNFTGIKSIDDLLKKANEEDFFDLNNVRQEYESYGKDSKEEIIKEIIKAGIDFHNDPNYYVGDPWDRETGESTYDKLSDEVITNIFNRIQQDYKKYKEESAFYDENGREVIHGEFENIRSHFKNICDHILKMSKSDVINKSILYDAYFALENLLKEEHYYNY